MEKVPYNLSVDYLRLFNLVEEGNRVAGYVLDPVRGKDYLQLVECYKAGEKYYLISYPGRSFESIMPFYFENSNLDVKTAFIQMVTNIDFKYIDMVNEK